MRKCEDQTILELSGLNGPLHEPCKGKRTVKRSVQMPRQGAPLAHLQGRPNGHLNGPFGTARSVEPPVVAYLGQVEHATSKGYSTEPQTGRYDLHGPFWLPWRDAFDSSGQDPQGLLNGSLDGPLRPARAVEPPVQVALSQTPEVKAKGASTRP